MPRSIEKANNLNSVEYIIILGAGLKKDGSPSDMLADRLKTGVILLEAHSEAKLILTGDNSGEHYNEVAAMKKFNPGSSNFESYRLDITPELVRVRATGKAM